MSGALESSVTLDDVFVVVGARRVPLAAELAGYLALEIAEGAADAAGDVDPARVYIGEEGSVALVVRPRRDEAPTGDAEGSVRGLLLRLLEASGSQTPALGNVARRRGVQGGLGALVEELEAALIPVNRAAGRRALARLAREVKRVTLQIGRNASLSPSQEAPRRGSSPAHSAVREPPPSVTRPVESAPAPRVVEAARVVEAPRAAEPARSATPAPPVAAPTDSAPSLPADGWGDEPPTNAKRELPQELRSTRDAAPSVPGASELPTRELRREQATGALASRSATPPPVAATEPPKPRSADEVDHLLAAFAVSSGGDQVARNELKALVGLEPTPPPPGSQHMEDDEPPPPQAPHESDVESLLSLSGPAPAVSRGSPPARSLASPPTAISPKLANEPYSGHVATVASAQMPPTPPREPRASRSSYDDARGVPTSPSARKLADISSFRQPTAPATGRALSVGALLVVGVGTIGLYVGKPEIFSGRSTPLPPATSSSAPTSAPGASQPPRCRESITVNGAPQNAEVLLRVGQAPVDVDHMPSGAPLEFVATAEGFAPKRVVIPAGATWDTGSDGKPRFEAAVQLDRSRARAGAVDNWPAAEAGSEVGGKGGTPGTVHLVTTPRGAEVWLLAGLGPTARIEDLKCGGDAEVLVAGPTTLRKRLHIAEGSFAAVDGGANREAIVTAK